MQDVFRPDPEHPGFWIYNGRVDDLIVFASGAKYDPNKFEQTITSHPLVKAAVMVGTGRPVAALIIEPLKKFNGSEVVEAEFLHHIWPTVEEANRTCRHPTCISKDRVLVSGPGKPLPRTAKGSIAKSQLLKLCAAELDQLYKDY